MSNEVIEKSWIDGCFISKISRVDLLEKVRNWIKTKEKGRYITAINVSKFVMMQRDAKLSDFVLNSHITIADGFPIFLSTRLLGDPIPERVTGADLMEELLRMADVNKFGVYFFGSKPKVLEGVLERCRTEFPDLRIAGFRDGYFKKKDEELIVKEIASADPDILFVALGVPQKEYFVHDHLKELNASVILPVGGAFDVYAGLKKRAPFWVQKLGIEWLWRSVYDRTRAGLVLKSMISFSKLLFVEIIRKRFNARGNSKC